MEQGKISLPKVKEMMEYAKGWNNEGWPYDGIRCWMDKTDISTYRTYSDSFVAMCAKVRDVNETTREIIGRTLLPISNYECSFGENVMAPFYNRCLTLYIGGDGNRGSWQLVNELLDMPNLLPDSTKRTMGPVISIENSESLEVVIRYNDGHEDTLKGNVKQILPDLVSMDNGRSQKLMQITVRMPLPETYKHWKIVVDDQSTWNRRTDVEKSADARVYVLADDKVETLQRTVSMNQCPERKNIFYVTMAGCDFDGLKTQRERVESAHGLIYCPEERLHHCCIPAYHLVCDGNIDYKAAEKSVTCAGWDEPAWSECRHMITSARKLLGARGLSFNNENIKQTLDEWSGFNTFRQQLLKYMNNTENELFSQFYCKLTSVLNDYKTMMIGSISSKEKELGLEKGSLMNIRTISEEMNRFKAQWSNTLKLIDYIQNKYSEEYIDKYFKGNLKLCTKLVYLISNMTGLKDIRLTSEDIPNLCKSAETLMSIIENDLQRQMEGMPDIKYIFSSLRIYLGNLNLNTLFPFLEKDGQPMNPESAYKLVQSFGRYLSQKIKEALDTFVKKTFMILKATTMKYYTYHQLWLNADDKAVPILELLMTHATIEALLGETLKRLQLK